MPDPRQWQQILEARRQRTAWRETATTEERQLAALELIADSLAAIKDDLSDIKGQMIAANNLQGAARRL